MNKTTTGKLATTRYSVSRVVRLVILLVLFLLAYSGVHVARAQDEVEWVEPVVLHTAKGDALVDMPVIVAAPTGLVTLLWTAGDASMGEDANQRHLVYCMQWDGEEWSEAVDVLVSPDGASSRFVEAALGPDGLLHAVWTGTNSRLYYSHADHAQACLVRSWSEPIVVSFDPVLRGAIATDDAGTVHSIFALRGGDVYYTSSEDAGAHWLEPVSISQIEGGNRAADDARLAVDDAGTIHVIWDEATLPDGVPWLGFYYARSTDGGQTWSVPLEIADSDHGNGFVFGDSDGAAHLTWNGSAAVHGRYHQWSSDGGASWSSPVEVVAVDAGGGRAGGPRLAEDSTGALHLVSGIDSAIVYSRWDGRAWTPYEVISEASGILEGSQEQARLAINLGNEIHVVYEIDSKKLGYVRGRAAAPEVPPAVLPTPVPRTPVSPTGSPQAVATVEQGVTPAVATVRAEDLGVETQEPMWGVLLGVVPAVALIVVVSAIRLMQSRERQ